MPASELSHGRYALILALCAAAAAGLLFAYSLCVEPFDGDLARIAELPEELYGRRSPQERFDRSLAVSSGSYDRYHDVVVVGDSFSTQPEGGAWTEFFIRETGASVLLLPRDLRPQDLLDMPAFRSEPPKVVLYESVERLLKERLTGIPAAAPEPERGVRRPRPLRAAPRREAPSARERRLRKDLSEGDVRQGKDRLLAALARSLGRKSKVVREIRLKRAAFSSRRADAMLVYVADEQKTAWSRSDLDGMREALRAFRRAAESGGRTLFLSLVIPDKLSAYADDIADPSEGSRLRFDFLLDEDLHPVPVRPALQALIRAGTLDVYLPADTHLGSAGARAVSDAVLLELRRRGALSPRSEVP